MARIYDPRRAAIYQRLGIPTVATVAWTTERVLRRILPDEPGGRVGRPERQASCSIERVVPGAVGRAPAAGAGDRPAVQGGGGRPARHVARCPTADLVVQEGDVVYLAVAGDAIDASSTTAWPGRPRGGH